MCISISGIIGDLRTDTTLRILSHNECSLEIIPSLFVVRDVTLAYRAKFRVLNAILAEVPHTHGVLRGVGGRRTP